MSQLKIENQIEELIAIRSSANQDYNDKISKIDAAIGRLYRKLNPTSKVLLRLTRDNDYELAQAKRVHERNVKRYTKMMLEVEKQ